MTTQQPNTEAPTIYDAVFTLNAAWEITSFNKGAEKITGLIGKDVLGKNCHEVFSNNKSLAGLCEIQKPLASGHSVNDFRLTITLKDSSEKIFALVNAIPIPGDDDKLSGVVITLRPVTSPCMIYPLVLNSIADGVFTIDQDLKITSFNHAAEMITGWKQKEVLNLSCNDLFQAAICTESCLIDGVKNEVSITNHSLFVKGKNGKPIPCAITKTPLIDPENKIIGGVVTFRDQTRSIQHDLVLESVADGVFTVDRNWKITSFNRAAEKITGWSRENAIGQSCSEVFHSSICGDTCAIAQSLYSGLPVANRSINIKTAEGQRLPISISAAPLLDHEGNIIGGVETFRDLSEISTLRKQLSKRYTFGEIISKSPAMRRIFDIMPEIAQSESNVLILGESGTGKELIARATHNSSNRRKGPFVTVNCGALPENLLESELFGYKAGAFTDAKKDRLGRFAAAEKGTLFLDEIGDIPAALQVKLLRVLQNKVYEPLGSSIPVTADVRILAATNRHLHLLVEEGTFREDLFYRLNVVKIMLPPLRERMEDIPMLCEHFIKKFSAQQGKDIIGLSDAALSILMRHDFPGNIRELENIIEYAFILCHGGFIQPEHLPEAFAPRGKSSKNVDEGRHSQSLEEIEKQAILTSLERNQWKKLATCRELGISKDTLRRKIQRYELGNILDDTELE
ncbi:MAG: sigma 54-interacting transcriptional regulator [Proteobacteria bacterium]|nr:sigma 54-interacting transcriptional regulator [Pseudomonadota bacterium]MBU1715600.1 sigma 54-interacting transcriptional regulator [Pseudomonadota bacterium]